MVTIDVIEDIHGISLVDVGTSLLEKGGEEHI